MTRYAREMIYTWLACFTVLVTLSGDALNKVLWATGATVLIHVLLNLLGGSDE